MNADDVARTGAIVPDQPLPDGPLGALLSKILAFDYVVVGLKALAVLLLGLAALRLITMLAKRIARGRLEGHAADMVVRGVRYAGFVIIAINLFEVLGLDLSALLGAAGIAGIALGFAAQTSMSNLISGLFLLSEKSFGLGDVVQVDATTGVVEAVDLLSVKLRTFDNRLVRIPNETLVKSNLINATRYAIRRLDIPLGVVYGSDLALVREILLGIAERSELVLAEPEPLFLADAYEASSIRLLFGPWIRKDDFLAAKNELLPTIDQRLREAGIRLAYQTITIVEDRASKPQTRAQTNPGAASKRGARKHGET